MFALQMSPKTERKVEYQCQDCFTEFCLISKQVSCPNCSSNDLSHMVIIYTDDDPETHEMLTQADWRAGD